MAPAQELPAAWRPGKGRGGFGSRPIGAYRGEAQLPWVRGLVAKDRGGRLLPTREREREERIKGGTWIKNLFFLPLPKGFSKRFECEYCLEFETL